MMRLFMTLAFARKRRRSYFLEALGTEENANRRGSSMKKWGWVRQSLGVARLYPRQTEQQTVKDTTCWPKKDTGIETHDKSKTNKKELVRRWDQDGLGVAGYRQRWVPSS